MWLFAPIPIRRPASFVAVASAEGRDWHGRRGHSQESWPVAQRTYETEKRNRFKGLGFFRKS
jgi:hypothetical protein